MTVKVLDDISVMVPVLRKNFVNYGYYDDLKKILSTRKFFPIYISGLSGLGKTVNVHQACAELNYPLIRINLTENTTEDHLFGGFRLVEGETVFYKGPVIKAMETGSLLLLDEGDQAPPTLNMALQSILEGDCYYIKQTGEKILPKDGFNVVLCANTKGKGDETGNFIGAQIQNEANLDRYAITFDHGFPVASVETKILKNEFKLLGLKHHEFHDKLIETLVKWAGEIRKSLSKKITAEVISTRRLVHFASAYAIFQHKHKVLDLILSRFDLETKIAWKDFFLKIDGLSDKINTIEEYEGHIKKLQEAKMAQAKDPTKSINDDFINAFYDINTKNTLNTGASGTTLTTGTSTINTGGQVIGAGSPVKLPTWFKK